MLSDVCNHQSIVNIFIVQFFLDTSLLDSSSVNEGAPKGIPGAAGGEPNIVITGN